LIQVAMHDTQQNANNTVEADHGRRKVRLRPMRGVKSLRSAHTRPRGHTFVQNLRRGHYEITPICQLDTASAPRSIELALAI
jgi:transposase-like protein